MNDAFIQRVIVYSRFKVLFVTYSIIQNIISSEINKTIVHPKRFTNIWGGGGLSSTTTSWMKNDHFEWCMMSKLKTDWEESVK